MVQKYLNKISGPRLERIDLRVEVTPVPFAELSSTKMSENSISVRDRVLKAPDIQAKQFEKHNGIDCNWTLCK